MKHKKFEEVKKLVGAKQPVLLTGERGSGKTSLLKQVADSLELKFFSMSMTRQTTLSHLLGFRNVDGVYMPSPIRDAAEQGGVVVLDEIDASDVNVLLCFNTVDNGYIAFPDGVVYLHKDFVLCATSNPQNNHKEYNGRSKLDAATLDRFDIINVERDENLEKSLISFSTFQHIDIVRKSLESNGSSKYISMRDALRYEKRKELGLLENYVEKLFGYNELALSQYKNEIKKLPSGSNLDECETVEDLWLFIDNYDFSQEKKRNFNNERPSAP